MKRTKRPKVASGLLERQIFGNNLDYVGLRADAIDGFLRYAVRHYLALSGPAGLVYGHTGKSRVGMNSSVPVFSDESFEKQVQSERVDRSRAVQRRNLVLDLLYSLLLNVFGDVDRRPQIY
jgi:hypothetical protein